jgi:hypothetical protein
MLNSGKKQLRDIQRDAKMTCCAATGHFGITLNISCQISSVPETRAVGLCGGTIT